MMTSSLEESDQGVQLEPGYMNFDKNSWVAYKDAKKAFTNSAQQEIEDSPSKGKISNGYLIQAAQEDPRETQSQQCLSDNEHKRWDESYQVADAILSSVTDSNQ
ncbi:hypothetical protein PPACK8108_LOCUS24630 [Phakopsora pachyrhizi]|uniref:Uncharacterized protein n=1 Tax=Phakopsora pachyrhizi TaxID=170000 RepID=A0AAV0BTW3_PHAPC|nr:hypothetical protein PPACK8108_LOCUS24630 [Phakopsora pachyrhizi]